MNDGWEEVALLLRVVEFAGDESGMRSQHRATSKEMCCRGGNRTMKEKGKGVDKRENIP